jgi:hypothetical protein
VDLLAILVGFGIGWVGCDLIYSLFVLRRK